MMRPPPDDSLAEARGLVVGLVIATVFWFCFIVLAILF